MPQEPQPAGWGWLPGLQAAATLTKKERAAAAERAAVLEQARLHAERQGARAPPLEL